MGGEAPHIWSIATRTFQATRGGAGGATGPDDDIAVRGFADAGAWIIGRNMFGPLHGPWPDAARQCPACVAAAPALAARSNPAGDPSRDFRNPPSPSPQEWAIHLE